MYDYDTGNPLPDGWKEVRRCMGGKFLICPKYGPYNGIRATYDGRNTQCDSDLFRAYVVQLIDVCKICKQKRFDEEKVLNSLFSTNQFAEPKEFNKEEFLSQLES